MRPASMTIRPSPPAVWNTATVFFQLVLLGGYAFAHLTLRSLGTRRQPILQLLALLVPLAVAGGFLFSAAVGIFFGYYPARRAANLP